MFQNRDHSSQSHQSGGYSSYNNNSSTSHHHSNNQFQLGDKVKAIGFPPINQNHQSSPSPGASASHSAPNVMTSPLSLHSRTVQTEPMEEKVKVKKVIVMKEPEEVQKEKDALQDTVMAFMEVRPFFSFFLFFFSNFKIQIFFWFQNIF